MNNNHLKQVVLLGGPAVGKGYAGRILKNQFPEMETLAVGDLIRNRLKTDMRFNSLYGQLVRSGELLPDHETLVMVRKSYESLPEKTRCLLVDGLYRTKFQVMYGEKYNWLTPENAIVIYMMASHDTLRMRYEDRVQRNAKSSEGGRNDDLTFPRRYEIFEEKIQTIHSMLQKRGIKMSLVDANHPLDQAAEDVAKIVGGFWGVVAKSNFYTNNPTIPPESTPVCVK